MITTGIHIPAAVQRKLTSTVASVHRETEPLTFADLRKRDRDWDRRDGSHLCYFHVTFGKKGAVKSIAAHLRMKPRKKFTIDGFEAEVPLFGRADMAARRVMPAMAEFLIHREVEHRKSERLREMIEWQDEELQDATRFGLWTPTEALHSSPGCGTVSEVLRAHLAQHEIACREGESNHAHLNARAENKSFLLLCRKALTGEREAAEQWAEERKAAGWTVSTRYMFENRSEEDRTMIAYRDKVGW